MKINIGPYISRWTTNNFEHWYLEKRFKDEYWNVDEHQYSKFDDFVINKFCDWWQSVLNRTINLYLDRKERKIKIQIDRWDTWSMDHTLSMIVVPMLEQLRDTKHGSPFVDDEDVPEELRSYNSPGENEWDTDGLFHERWKWVINEMIFAHTAILDEETVDYLQPAEHHERVSNGLRLFGKYYRGLWD